MSSDTVINIESLSKTFNIYEKPIDRLKQALLNRFDKGNKKYFRTFQALDDVSFTVNKGETVGIIGRNGAGKSTLLQIICNTLSPTSGSVSVKGRVAALLELGAGFNPEFTGKENVYMNASVLGLTDAEIDERYQKIIDFADIGDFIEQPVKTYSSGMYVRLAFAVIAHVDADVLIVDEALAVGDVFFTQKCMRFLKSFMKTGTVLFVSHDTSMIQSLCDRAVILERGVIIKEGDAKSVSEHYVKMQYGETQVVLDDVNKAPKEKSVVKNDKTSAVESYSELEDCRLSIINESNLKNIIDIFEFKEDSESFGAGGAEIFDVSICDEQGNNLICMSGNDLVTINIKVRVLSDFDNMIVGFMIQNKYGQRLFGDNTYIKYLEKQCSFVDDEVVQASFTFILPVLPKGDYTISIAVADGSQDDHVQHVWMHDALAIKSISSHVSHGLIALPMKNISLEKVIK